ncbi:MAG: hypothetical protein GQ583_10090 [Methyloprofundus sp.]|nr:hypothetical protein [Methyloprofundus sp.]
MLNIRSISVSVIATLITFSPTITLAAEQSTSSLLPPIWPFIAFVILVIVFRKQLNCVPPFESPEEPASPVNQEPIPTATETPDTAADIDTEVNDNIIDLKDNSQQCQASTAKGARCKRKTTLEDTSLTIDEKTYLLTVCRQHNTSSLKPYPELIK